MIRWNPRRLMITLAVFALWATAADAQVFFLRDTFCSNQFIIVNGHLYSPDNPTGTEVLPGAAANGMDSIIEVRLVFYQPAFTLIEEVLCEGDTLWVNNVPYHAGFNFGEEVIEGGAANGCDSIIDVNLTVVPRAYLKIDQILCEGDTLFVNGRVYDALNPAGIEIIPGGAANGLCDSTIEVNLRPVALPYFVLEDTLCPDTFLLINGRRYDRDTRAGLEVLAGASAIGCDSLVYVSLVFRDDLWISLGDDREVYYGDSICLDLLTSFTPDQLEWTPPLPCADASCLTVCQTFFTDSNLEVFALDQATGCLLHDDLRITVTREAKWYAPNAFKPEGSAGNNRFYISTGAGIVRINNLRIVNRWGELMFERENLEPGNPSDGWDGIWKGDQAPPGVYVFWAESEWRDGTTEILSGSFALIR